MKRRDFILDVAALTTVAVLPAVDAFSTADMTFKVFERSGVVSWRFNPLLTDYYGGHGWYDVEVPAGRGYISARTLRERKITIHDWVTRYNELWDVLRATGLDLGIEPIGRYPLPIDTVLYIPWPPHDRN